MQSFDYQLLLANQTINDETELAIGDSDDYNEYLFVDRQWAAIHELSHAYERQHLIAQLHDFVLIDSVHVRGGRSRNLQNRS